MRPKNSTPLPPQKAKPCGHIQRRTLKNGRESYRVVINCDRSRGGRRVTRVAGTLDDAQDMLDAAQQAMLGPLQPVIQEHKRQIIRDDMQKRIEDLLGGSTRSLIYYVRIPITGQVKIGVTTNVRHRLSQFATIMDDIELLAVELGGRTKEQRRHRDFEKYRIPGTERFLPGPELLRHIDALRSGLL